MQCRGITSGIVAALAIGLWAGAAAAATAELNTNEWGELVIGQDVTLSVGGLGDVDSVRIQTWLNGEPGAELYALVSGEGQAELAVWPRTGISDCDAVWALEMGEAPGERLPVYATPADAVAALPWSYLEVVVWAGDEPLAATSGVLVPASTPLFWVSDAWGCERSVFDETTGAAWLSWTESELSGTAAVWIAPAGVVSGDEPLSLDEVAQSTGAAIELSEASASGSLSIVPGDTAGAVVVIVDVDSDGWFVPEVDVVVPPEGGVQFNELSSPVAPLDPGPMSFAMRTLVVDDPDYTPCPPPEEGAEECSSEPTFDSPYIVYYPADDYAPEAPLRSNGTKRPLVVLAHANPGQGGPLDSYLGFEYIAHALVERGYIVASYNRNKYAGGMLASGNTSGDLNLFEKHVANLLGGSHGLPTQGHVDSNHVLFVGHSRGATAAAVRATAGNPTGAAYHLSGTVHIAPAHEPHGAFAVPSLTLSGDLDHDVGAQAAQMYYESLSRAPAHAAYLLAASGLVHNLFNSFLGTDVPNTCLETHYSNAPNQYFGEINRSAYEQFAASSILAFVRTHVEGDAAMEAYLTGEKPLPFWGRRPKVRADYVLPGLAQTLVDDFSAGSNGLNAFGGSNSAAGSSSATEIDTDPGLLAELYIEGRGLRLIPGASGTAFTLDLNGSRDVTAHTHLSLRAAQVPIVTADDTRCPLAYCSPGPVGCATTTAGPSPPRPWLTHIGPDADLQIRLVDSLGATSRPVSLSAHSGGGLPNSHVGMSGTVTAYQRADIPLTAFQGTVDLGHLSHIEVIAPKSHYLSFALEFLLDDLAFVTR